MVNGVPWEVPESTQCTSSEEDRSSPKGFSKGEPKARPKGKNPRGRRPRGFFAFGLIEDVAKGLPLENPEGGLQYYIKYSRDLPRAPFTMMPPRLSHRFSFFLPNTPVY